MQSDGSLKPAGYQRTAAHVRDFFFLSEGLPPGEFLVIFCKNGRCIQLFKRDAATGALSLYREIPIWAYYGEPVHGVVYSR